MIQSSHQLDCRCKSTEFPHITALWRLAYVEAKSTGFVGGLADFRKHFAEN